MQSRVESQARRSGAKPPFLTCEVSQLLTFSQEKELTTSIYQVPSLNLISLASSQVRKGALPPLTLESLMA